MPVLESIFNKVAGLTTILKNIWQRLLLHCTQTTHCYLSVLLYIQHLPHHHCYYSVAVFRRYSIKKGVLKTFAKFTGKQLCQSLFFNKVAELSPASLLKKRRWHRCFVNFAKFLGTPFFIEHPCWLLPATANISNVSF